MTGKSQRIDSVETQAPATTERLRLMHQSLLNICGPVLSSLIGLILVPLMLRGLGAELYGLWVIVVTVAGRCAAIADLGISWSVIREVAACAGGADRDGSAQRFVSAAANAYLLLAIAGAAIIAAMGLPVNRFMPISMHGTGNLPGVFMLAAGGFIAGQMLNFQIAILQGLRRFDLSNLLSLSSALLSGIGIIVLLWLGGGLLGVMEAQAASWVLCALAGYKLVIRAQPRFRQHLGRLDWASLRPRLRFSLGMQLTSLLSGITWGAVPLLIGFMLGPALVSSYYIGCKFQVALDAMLWPVAVVTFPAASEQHRAGDPAPASEVLEAGTRWLALLAMPISVMLWIVAPDLLRAWLGRVPPDVLAIFRLMTVTELIYAISMTPTTVLMGRGIIATLLAITGLEAAVVTALTVVLLGRIGIRGAAWAVLLPMPFITAAWLGSAARNCGFSLRDLLPRVFGGQAFPIVTCGVITFLVLHACEPGRWVGVIVAALAGAIAYTASFYLSGAREEERIFLRQGLEVSQAAAAQGCVALRALAHRLGA